MVIVYFPFVNIKNKLSDMFFILYKRCFPKYNCLLAGGTGTYQGDSTSIPSQIRMVSAYHLTGARDIFLRMRR